MGAAAVTVLIKQLGSRGAWGQAAITELDALLTPLSGRAGLICAAHIPSPATLSSKDAQ